MPVHSPPRTSYSAAMAVFCLGLGFGIAAFILPLHQIVAAGVVLAFITALVGVLRHLAERSDEQLLAGDFSYRDFFDTAIEGIFRTTPSGHYLDVNPALARIYGYDTPEEMIAGLTDISSQLYVDPRRREQFKMLMQEHDEVIDFVSQIRRRDGTTIWIKENARALRDWAGRLVCYQGTVEDVTDRFAAEMAIKKGLLRAEEANRTKNAFLAMMSHELKTPLNAILGFSDMIRQEMLGPLGNASYRGYVEDIHSSGNKLLAIINDVLDVARLEGDAITLNRSRCAMQDVADLALRRVRLLCNDERAVEVSIDDEIGTLFVDQNRLAQVLTNLLANAFKFTPACGRIGLSATASPRGGLNIAVSDSGIGMSEETIAMVLQPFHQADASLARRFEGAGLGLPIAHALVGLHGGDLLIASGEGKGTTVTVELPATCLAQGEEGQTALAS